MRGYCLVMLFSCFVYLAYPQNISKVDSLKSELKHSKNKSEIYNQLAEQYARVSPSECMNYAQQAYYWAVKEGDKTQMAEAIRFKAWVYGSLNEYDRSIRVADSALFLFRETKNDKKVIECQYLKASAIMLQGRYDIALEMFNTNAEEAKNLKAFQLYATIQIQIGRIHRVRGNYEGAISCFEKAINIGNEIKNNILLANAYHHIGLVYQDKQNLGMAIEYFIKGLPLFEKENLLTQLPYVYISLGSAYRDSKNYSESLKYLHRASEYLTSLHDRWGLSELNRNMGMTYMELKKLDSASICFQNSLNYCREINEKAGESDNLKFLGEILIMQKEYEKSIKYLQEALQLNAQFDNKLELTNILYNLGRVKVYMGNYNEGLNLLKRSLVIADSLDVIYEEMIIHKEISTAYLKQDKYREALKHFEIYSILKDSIYKTESNRHFVEMEQKYKSEKQKQEISQLRIDKIEQDSAIRKQRSVRNIFILGFMFAAVTGLLFYRSFRARKKADMEKGAMLKEIHHRVKNNLQIISSLLSIQSDYVSDTKVISAVQESQGRVKAMALIHQLLYQNQDLSTINFAEYLPQLVNAISSIYKKEGTTVNVQIEAENISFDIDMAIPLGLIITELTANAFKYAFNDKGTGKLFIKITKSLNDEYLLTLADDGPGLPQGMKVDELNSMGLKLVNILTSQLDGTFEYKYNQGAIFNVKFEATK
jgi:two-component system, sensor histidine kinase PdtaS